MPQRGARGHTRIDLHIMCNSSFERIVDDETQVMHTVLQIEQMNKSVIAALFSASAAHFAKAAE